MAKRQSLRAWWLGLVTLAVALQLFAPMAMASAHLSRSGCHPTGCPMHHQQNLPQAPDGKCCILSQGQAIAAPAAHDLLTRPALARMSASDRPRVNAAASLLPMPISHQTAITPPSDTSQLRI